jgi:glycosyltransferase involved in cell wall biosynthesis
MHVMFVEASSGGVVGGSLTGLQHLIHGLDPRRFTCSMVLYEPKSIESDLLAHRVRLHRVHRRRLPKQHRLLEVNGYRNAKRIGAIARALRWARQGLRFAIEELPTALELRRLIRAERPDVLHLGNGVRANFDALVAARLTDLPVVCHVKGFEKYGGRERHAAREIDALVHMTRAIHAHCLENGVMARCDRVVYDAVDEAGFQPARDRAAVRAELGAAVAGLNENTPCVGIVGNIQEWKGQAIVVEAMARVRTRIPEARCFIVGAAHRAGRDYEAMLRRRVAELGLTGVVHFTGFRSDVPDLVQALDVVVHASVRPEPFGRVILESMLLGRPVIAAAAGGVPELITDGETGFLTPPGDATALAERLSEVLVRADMRREVAERGRTWARERFSLSRHVAEMSEIYEHVKGTH